MVIPFGVAVETISGLGLAELPAQRMKALRELGNVLGITRSGSGERLRNPERLRLKRAAFGRQADPDAALVFGVSRPADER
jgi:hypothetical protein